MKVRTKAIGLALLMFAGLAAATAAHALQCQRVRACAGGHCVIYLVCDDGSVWQEA
ncbi:MAG: hypothetical protein AB7S42_06545 [Lysobacteraceae bacterium]